MKRHWKGIIVLVVFLSLVGIIWWGWTLIPQDNVEIVVGLKEALLDTVGVNGDYDVRGHYNWYDFLMYTDGYEIIAVQMPGDWQPPANWQRAEMTIEEIEEKYNLILNDVAWQRIEMVQQESLAHFFTETGRDAALVDDWEFYVGFWQKDGRLIVYRGHHLYGAMGAQKVLDSLE